jgi:polyisoprenyl-phosphate glycosyltransferase
MKVSLIISVFNEEQVLPLFWDELHKVIRSLGQHRFECVWVNDGSTDTSQTLISQICSDPGFYGDTQSIEFSRNYGHEAAMIAGVDYATGEVMICMDADLQHPPSSIPAMLDAFKEGVDIVTMTRSSRADSQGAKKGLSRWFYKMLNALSDFEFEKNASDFFLVSRRVADILKNNFRERNRFLRGYIQIIGFDKRSLTFDAEARAAGETKYSYSKLFSLANVAIFSFSRKPLYLAMFLAVVFILISIALVAYTLFMFFWGDEPPPGYTTVLVFTSVSFASLFFVLAILSLYVGRGVEEIKERPIYLLKNRKSTSE